MATGPRSSIQCVRKSPDGVRRADAWPRLSGLLGGKEKLQVHFAAGMSDDEVSALHKTPKLIEESDKYIRGARSTNPLRGQN